MTKLDHFRQWALSRYPQRDHTIGGGSGDSAYFFNNELQMAWAAFNHAFTVRPTTNTRLNSAEFMKDNPETIVDRLNGVFPTAEPPYKMSPLHYEAAREIERLRGVMVECMAALQEVVSLSYRHVCLHEETYRGGTIWEICSSCGAKWADDEGGKPVITEPQELGRALAIIAKHQANKKPAEAG